jgi:Flp pilus assembly protein TadG
LTTALLFTALLGFFALAFNVGLMMDTRAELQNGSDAAALAGARSLNGMARSHRRAPVGV